MYKRQAWYEAEHRQLGIEFPPTSERFDRLEDALEIIIRLSTGDVVSYDGHHFKLCLLYTSTLTAEALALGCAWCFARWRAAEGVCLRPRRSALLLFGGFGLGVVTGLTSPVVGSFLALVLCAVAVADWGRSPRQASVELGAAGVFLASAATLSILYPGRGYFPFPYGDLLAVLSVCALLASPLLATPRPVRVAALLYAGASVVLFVVPTPMGDNDARLGAYIGVPLVLCYLPRLAWRRRGQGDRRSPVALSGAHRATTAAVAAIVAIAVSYTHLDVYKRQLPPTVPT